jgi:membrane-associated phospholipid phosphatase
MKFPQNLIAVATAALITAAPAFAQNPQAAKSGLREELRLDLGKQFRAKPEERRVLLEAQENRVAPAGFPQLPERIRKFLEESWSFEARVAQKTPVLGMLLIWNEVAMQTTALDHTNPNPPGVSPPPYFAEQFGPPRTARAMAMVHIAIDEAVNAISPRNDSYMDIRNTIMNGLTAAELQHLLALQAVEGATAQVAINRAIVEAAYQSLVSLYPMKQPLLEIARELTLREFRDPRSPAVLLGTKVGALASAAIVQLRMDDNPKESDLTTAAFPPGNPLKWHMDPISQNITALGGNYTKVVKPFLIPAADAFRNKWLPGPPAPGTPKFIESYNQVKDLGGDPNASMADGNRQPTPTSRSGKIDPNKPRPPGADPNEDQTFVGIFWAYDGSAYLCAPPRLYNMIATSVALRELPIERVEDFSHYLALLNVTMADAALAAWDGKYAFVFPRPVTYLREADANGNPAAQADQLWTPLGGQATNAPMNAQGNFSPPFPAYPSGHATFGGAVFRAMTLYFRSAVARGVVVPWKPLPDGLPEAGLPFTFVSDEYNGRNYGPGQKAPRARVEACFASFTQAERLNADSRIYLGVHWKFDADDGISLGNAVAEDTFQKFIKPAAK